MSESSETQKGLLSYVADLAYGATKYPCGWVKPSVVRGFFADSRNGELQQVFFDALLEQQFRRTYWQLVFPGQTAGLVRKRTVSSFEPNEHHVRFYDDGVIDCELEYDRFNRQHWTGKREGGIAFLHDFLDAHVGSVTAATKDEIRFLFAHKQYTEHCIRNGTGRIVEAPHPSVASFEASRDH